MDNPGINEAARRLFRYGEKVGDLKRRMMESWPQIPAGLMDRFGDLALAAGVVLWMRVNWDKQDETEWPRDPATIMGLQAAVGSERKIGEVLEVAVGKLGLVGTQMDQVQATFAEMLKWQVVDQLHSGLFANQKVELARILDEYNSQEKHRRVLDQLNIMATKSYFEQALKKSFSETQEIFTWT